MLYALLAVSTLSVLGVVFVHRSLTSKIAAITFPSSEVVAAVSRLSVQGDAREQSLRDQVRFLQESVVGLANERLRAQIVKPASVKDSEPEPPAVLQPTRWNRASGIRSDTFSAARVE